MLNIINGEIMPTSARHGPRTKEIYSKSNSHRDPSPGKGIQRRPRYNAGNERSLEQYQPPRRRILSRVSLRVFSQPFRDILMSVQHTNLNSVVGRRGPALGKHLDGIQLASSCSPI